MVDKEKFATIVVGNELPSWVLNKVISGTEDDPITVLDLVEAEKDSFTCVGAARHVSQMIKDNGMKGFCLITGVRDEEGNGVPAISLSLTRNEFDIGDDFNGFPVVYGDGIVAGE